MAKPNTYRTTIQLDSGHRGQEERHFEVIEALRTANPIEQVIGEHVQLRRSGLQLRGRCPFHPERTPSFYLHPGKGLFHCHSCQAGGDVFEFIRRLHGCSFQESVVHLAERAGIHLDGFRPSPELTAKVAALKAQREEQMEFKRFCDERLRSIADKYRSLGRAATHAEDYLRTCIGVDFYLDGLAWAALERFRLFEARVEREGLCDLDILDAEWRSSPLPPPPPPLETIPLPENGAKVRANQVHMALAKIPNPFDPAQNPNYGPRPSQRLLDFVESLILDVAHTDPRVTQAEVASWLARVVVGGK